MTTSAFKKPAVLIEHKDNKSLDEIVALIARLAIPINTRSVRLPTSEAASVGGRSTATARSSSPPFRRPAAMR
jgi:hypothetical protein